MRYSRDAIERKRRLGLWREAGAGEAAALDALECPDGREHDGGSASEGSAAAAPEAKEGPEGARARGGGGPSSGREERKVHGGTPPKVS